MTNTDNAELNNPNPLSEREMDVARLLAEGLSNGEIAHKLVLSPHTVKVHLRNIYGKLEVSSRTEATMSLVQQGWLVVEGVELAEPAPAPVVPALPEPLPLAPLAPTIAPWQRIYLMAAALICVLALGLPTLLAATTAQPLDLLSDRDRLTLGRPTLESLPRWEVRTPLPQARSRLAMVLLGNSLYVMGGETAQGETVGTVDLYNLTVNEWSQGADLPLPVANSGAAVLGERIFLAGGSTAAQPAQAEVGATSVVRDELWVFDAQAETWGVAGVLPAPLAGANLVNLDGALYLVGGWDGTALHDEVWRWVPGIEPALAEDWDVVARMASPRAFMGSVGLNGLIYVVGGYDGQEELAAAMTLDVSSGEWAALPDSLRASGGPCPGLRRRRRGGPWRRTDPGRPHPRAAGPGHRPVEQLPVPFGWGMAAPGRSGQGWQHPPDRRLVRGLFRPAHAIPKPLHQLLTHEYSGEVGILDW